MPLKGFVPSLAFVILGENRILYLPKFIEAASNLGNQSLQLFLTSFNSLCYDKL